MGGWSPPWTTWHAALQDWVHQGYRRVVGSDAPCPVPHEGEEAAACPVVGAAAAAAAEKRAEETRRGSRALTAEERARIGASCAADEGVDESRAEAAAGAANVEVKNSPGTNVMVPKTGQQRPLPVARMESSIPRGEFVPAHQGGGAGGAGGAAGGGGAGRTVERWAYPSEQMFYNAMVRKGFRPNEREMPAVVSIHNAVNERAWAQVMRYERLHLADDEVQDPSKMPVLVKFQGRPNDLSPRARWRTLLGYAPPFDRHDWLVRRHDGTHVRYVLDFYHGRGDATAGRPVGMHIDARPALDSPAAALDRARLKMHHWGIFL